MCVGDAQIIYLHNGPVIGLIILVAGSKDQYGGAMLLETSNLWLGAFGFLAGSTLQNNEGLANAGLLDQITALQ